MITVDEILNELNKNEDFKYLKSLYKEAFWIWTNNNYNLNLADLNLADDPRFVVEQLYNNYNLKSFEPSVQLMVFYVNYFYYIITILDELRTSLEDVTLNRPGSIVDKKKIIGQEIHLTVTTINSGAIIDFILDTKVFGFGDISIVIFSSGWGKRTDYTYNTSLSLYLYDKEKASTSLKQIGVNELTKTNIVKMYNELFDKRKI